MVHSYLPGGTNVQRAPHLLHPNQHPHCTGDAPCWVTFSISTARHVMGWHLLPSRLSHHMYTIAWVHPSPNRKQPQVVQPFLAQFMAESLYLTMGRPFPLKIAVCMGRPGPPSNTWFPEPTQVKNILNGITISSTIFAELTVVTDRLPDHTTAIYSSRTHLPI